MNESRRLGPSEEGGIARVHVGCGPSNLLEDWWNVDVRPFERVDQVLDATAPWPWRERLEFVYGEHFLEHLPIDRALAFLSEARQALKADGHIRLSTPSLEWVLATHFQLDEIAPPNRLTETWAINRAFYGWGHKFLYSREMLVAVLDAAGFESVTFHDYGASNISALQGLERHPGWSKAKGFPSVWIAEAVRGTGSIARETAFLAEARRAFIAHVESGH